MIQRHGVIMSSQEAPLEIPAAEPLAIATSTAIKEGDLPTLRDLLSQHPNLATALITSPSPDGQPEARNLLHIATDWPGHLPHAASTIHLLASAGANVSAPFRGAHEETPLHWAASNDDIAALDTLLDAGAAIEAPGAVLGGGPPLADAVGFKQWRAAGRLVERGAEVTLAQAAGLGMTGRAEAMLLGGGAPAGGEDVSRAFWYACHGGRLDAAKVMRRHGADVNWRPPWDGNTRPLDAAVHEGGEELVQWLREQGAVTGRGDDGTSHDEMGSAE